MKNKSLWIWSSVATVGLVSLYLAKKKREVQTNVKVVPYVDLDRYLGTWFEIAKLPTPFENSCYNVTAEYSKNEDGSIKVKNSCNKKSVNGPLEVVEGRATVADKESNAKLKVEFLWPFEGDCWILDIGDNYDYALVGEPSQKYLWILSRTPRLDDILFERLLLIASQNGYKTNELILTKHHT